jgi:hypothetical protein
MATRSVQHNLEVHRPLSSEDLRRVFESAVCEIHPGELMTQKELRYRAPIVPRAKVLGLSQAGAEKRALSDAARALAQLWKV